VRRSSPDRLPERSIVVSTSERLIERSSNSDEAQGRALERRGPPQSPRRLAHPRRRRHETFAGFQTSSAARIDRTHPLVDVGDRARRSSRARAGRRPARALSSRYRSLFLLASSQVRRSARLKGAMKIARDVADLLKPRRAEGGGGRGRKRATECVRRRFAKWRFPLSDPSGRSALSPAQQTERRRLGHACGGTLLHRQLLRGA